MSDAEYHVVEFRSIGTGQVQRVRGARKTDAEIEADRDESGNPNMIGVKVSSPGPTGMGTMVTSAATGDELKGVSHLSIDIGLDSFTTVEATLFSASVEVDGIATFNVADPSTGESKPVARIEFADGTEWRP